MKKEEGDFGLQIGQVMYGIEGGDKGKSKSNSFKDSSFSLHSSSFSSNFILRCLYIVLSFILILYELNFIFPKGKM